MDKNHNLSEWKVGNQNCFVTNILQVSNKEREDYTGQVFTGLMFLSMCFRLWRDSENCTWDPQHRSTAVPDGQWLLLSGGQISVWLLDVFLPFPTWHAQLDPHPPKKQQQTKKQDTGSDQLKTLQFCHCAHAPNSTALD